MNDLRPGQFVNARVNGAWRVGKIVDVDACGSVLVTVWLRASSRAIGLAITEIQSWQPASRVIARPQRVVTNTPVILCRCCGQPLRVEWQRGLGTHSGYYIVTCDYINAADGLPCFVEGFTLGEDYATLDLTEYIKTGMARRDLTLQGSR